MPGKSGLELLGAIRDVSPNTKCVILTGYGSINNAVEAVKLGAVGYVTKPADADQVLAAFEDMPRPTPKPDPDFPPPSLAEAQWEHIQRVLADTGGNISALRQFSLKWMLLAVTLFSIIFAVAATPWAAIGVMFAVGIFAPILIASYIAVVCFRDKLFGARERPLASSARDPLEITKYRP